MTFSDVAEDLEALYYAALWFEDKPGMMPGMDVETHRYRDKRPKFLASRGKLFFTRSLNANDTSSLEFVKRLTNFTRPMVILLSFDYLALTLGFPVQNTYQRWRSGGYDFFSRHRCVIGIGVMIATSYLDLDGQRLALSTWLNGASVTCALCSFLTWPFISLCPLLLFPCLFLFEIRGYGNDLLLLSTLNMSIL